jgi:hypothetical protein
MEKEGCGCEERLEAEGHASFVSSLISIGLAIIGYNKSTVL